MVERPRFAPDEFPRLSSTKPEDLLRWHTDQWRRIANYLLELEEHIDSLEARIAALEP